MPLVALLRRGCRGVSAPPTHQAHRQRPAASPRGQEPPRWDSRSCGRCSSSKTRDPPRRLASQGSAPSAWHRARARAARVPNSARWHMLECRIRQARTRRETAAPATAPTASPHDHLTVAIHAVHLEHRLRPCPKRPPQPVPSLTVAAHGGSLGGRAVHGIRSRPASCSTRTRERDATPLLLPTERAEELLRSRRRPGPGGQPRLTISPLSGAQLEPVVLRRRSGTGSGAHQHLAATQSRRQAQCRRRGAEVQRDQELPPTVPAAVGGDRALRRERRIAADGERRLAPAQLDQRPVQGRAASSRGSLALRRLDVDRGGACPPAAARGCQLVKPALRAARSIASACARGRVQAQALGRFSHGPLDQLRRTLTRPGTADFVAVVALGVPRRVSSSIAPTRA